MKSVVILAMMIVLAVSSSVASTPWWIPADDAVLNYSEDSNIWIIKPFAPMGLHMQYPAGDIWRYFSFDGEGDIYANSYTIMEPAMSLSPLEYQWDPPLKILDFPLTTGKTWQSESMWRPETGIPKAYTLTGMVVGPKNVTIGDYTIPVIEVVVEKQWSSFTFTTTYLLHEQLGDVSNLVSWSGTVANESISWGKLRCLYR